MGTYIVNGVGDLGGTPTVWAYDFDVTPNGKEFTTQNSISYIGFIIILFFTFILTMIGGWLVRWEHNKSDEG